MSDRVPSPGVELLWQIARGFALRNEDPSIEAKHLLYAICEMEKFAAWQSKPRIVTSAERCAILLRGADIKELLLKANQTRSWLL